MVLRIFFILSFFITITFTKAQVVDTIFTIKQKIGCSVKEVALDMVKYSYPGEDVINVLPVNQIIKIVFKSGRVQNFSTTQILKPVRYGIDWKNVLVTKNELDVYGLQKHKELTAIAWYGSLQSTRAFATEHLMKYAAMRGYKAIVKTFEESGFRENEAEAQISGIPYADSLPSLNKFKQIVGAKVKFKAITKYILKRYGLEEEEAFGHLIIKSYSEKEGIAYFYGDIGAHEGLFRLVYLGSTYFVVHFVGEFHEFNYVLYF